MRLDIGLLFIRSRFTKVKKSPFETIGARLGCEVDLIQCQTMPGVPVWWLYALTVNSE